MMDDYNKILGLYIHIPFCDHICSYCDFTKMIASDNRKNEYISSLIKEIEYKNSKNLFSSIQTIYIGGGTPSSLSFILLDKFLSSLSEIIDLNKIVEFTMEANPKDINDSNILAWIDLFKKYNITRLSLGVQSFNNKKLKYLNRNHTKKEAINALKLLHKYNFNNVNVDLIYGLKNDKYFHIKKDIIYAIKNHIKHISYYSLILEERTILYNLFKKGEKIEMDDEREEAYYQKIVKFLNKKGFMRYEISNFAKENYYSRHNMLTWDNKHYIGCGLAASYYIDNIRYKNTTKIADYIKCVNEGDFENIIIEKNVLSKDDIIYEALILGLRKEEGINLNEFKDRYNEDLLKYYKNIPFLIKNDILEIKDGNLAIKYDKIYLENYIIGKITD